MPTEVVRVSGDYKIEAKKGDMTIDLTSANHTGTLTLLGNFNIVGTQTSVVSVDSQIIGNILVLNSGETNPYVTLGTSGIVIARGNGDSQADAATLLYDDDLYWNDGVQNRRGAFKFGTASSSTAIQVDGLRVRSDVTKLNIFGTNNPNAVISVKGTTNYENNVLDDDDIPNKRYVDLKSSEIAKKVLVGNNFIEIISSDVFMSDTYYGSVNKISAALSTSTNIVFKLEGTTALVQGLMIDNARIYPVVTGTNLTLDVRQNGIIALKGPMSLLHSPAVSAVSQETRIYSTSTISGGGTGLYFVNTSTTDELVSRRRSIIYGIIF